jgi:hypothetical protein
MLLVNRLFCTLCSITNLQTVYSTLKFTRFHSLWFRVLN